MLRVIGLLSLFREMDSLIQIITYSTLILSALY